ncbi:MAG: GreA/GreB family elongation factor [Chloroflexi bacterium]|nr:GreA/GreB family elongation factor [Chloroflexota bacterium]
MKPRQQVLTLQGRDMVRAELDHLRTVRRPQVIERLRRLREQGAGQTYGECQEAKDEGAFVDGRIRELEALLAEAAVAQNGPAGAVALGSRVVVMVDGEAIQETYTIVGCSAEADCRSRRITRESPVGRALLGRKPGELVQVDTPAGPLNLHVLAVN